MGLFEDLQKKYVEARKAKEVLVSGVLSMLISDLKYEEINKDKTLDDGDVLSIIQKTLKQKKEVLIDFQKANRVDLADKESAEIEYLAKLLPAQMSEAEVREIALTVKTELGAVAPSDMGKVMKEVIARVKGRADGGMVKNIVSDILK